MFLFALLAPASASELVVYKNFPFAVHTWVDGKSIGKVKNKKKPTIVDVEPGRHEVWFSGEETGTITLCHGVVDVAADAKAEAYLGMGATAFRCNGLNPGYPDGPSAFKGAMIDFKVEAGDGKWVSIDGGQQFAFPSMPFELNLVPGTHSIVLYNDVHRTSVYDQGTVTLGAGQRLPVICTTAGCLGFDAPPVVIVEYQQAPSIQLWIGTDIQIHAGVHIDVK